MKLGADDTMGLSLDYVRDAFGDIGDFQNPKDANVCYLLDLCGDHPEMDYELLDELMTEQKFSLSDIRRVAVYLTRVLRKCHSPHAQYLLDSCKVLLNAYK
jgi:hypothetical protein